MAGARGHRSRSRRAAALVVLAALAVAASAGVWLAVSGSDGPVPSSPQVSPEVPAASEPPTTPSFPPDDPLPPGPPPTPSTAGPDADPSPPAGATTPPNLIDPAVPLPTGRPPGEEIPLVVNDPGAAAAVAASVPSVREGITVLNRYTVLHVPAASVGEVVADLRSRGVSEVIEDPVAQLASTVTPTDPFWGSWWGARTAGLPTAWGVSQGSADTVIAVVDTGVTPVSELTVPAPGGVPPLDRVLPGATWVGDNPRVDLQGHGTLTAVVAAGAINNGVGAGGACPRCLVLPLKVFPDPEYPGAPVLAQLSDVAAAVEYAANWSSGGRRVAAVNLSLGSLSEASVLRSAVAYAATRGVTLVAAAGNNGNSSPFYPAAYPEVIGVAGINEDLRLNAMSNRSPAWVSTAAPYTNISQGADGGIYSFSGTSSASPMVAGSVGLLRDANRCLSGSAVVAAVRAASSQPIPAVATAWGVFNAGALPPPEGDDVAGAPTALVVRPGDRTISVTWSPPADAVVRGVSAYEFEVSVDGGVSWVPVDPGLAPQSELTDGRLTATIAGLGNGVTHQVRVAARNDCGLGPWSGSSIPATPAVPGTLTDVFCGYLDLPFGRLTTTAACALRASDTMFGTSSIRFGVDDALTRGQAVTIVWRRAGRPAAPTSCGFSDVPTSTPSEVIVAQAVCWASANRIATGYSNGTFAPAAPVTRAQQISFLWREAGRPAAPLSCGYSDVPVATASQQIFAQSICWGTAQGIVSGYSNGTYVPSGVGTRGMYAAMLWRQVGRPAPPAPAPPDAVAMWFNTRVGATTTVELAIGTGVVRVDWGDGRVEDLVVEGSPARFSHTYATDGYYLVTLTGVASSFGSTTALAGASALVAISGFGEPGNINDFVWPVRGATNLAVVTRNPAR